MWLVTADLMGKTKKDPKAPKKRRNSPTKQWMETTLSSVEDLLRPGKRELETTMAKEHIRPPLVSFDQIDYEDPTQLRQAQESLLREDYIRMKALAVCRKALGECFRHHGVNQYEECRDLAEKYLKLLPDNRLKGFYGYQKNDPSK